MGSKLFPSKIEKTTILNTQSIRMLQTHVNNNIYTNIVLYITALDVFLVTFR